MIDCFRLTPSGLWAEPGTLEEAVQGGCLSYTPKFMFPRPRFARLVLDKDK